MDIKTIENEIYDFASSQFQDYYAEIEETYDFIENNHLHIPKENYLKLSKYLLETFKFFRTLDIRSMSETSKKLYLDITNFQKNIEILENSNKQHLFHNHFLSFSTILSLLGKEVVSRKEQRVFIEEALYETLLNDYNNLKKIYYGIFLELMHNEIDELIKNYKELLNSKLFYFDKLIWKEARASHLITRHYALQNASLKLDSKSYLTYSLSLLHPSTKEFTYLQSCLRIYK